MTQAMPPNLPASIGSTSAGGTAKKSEPQEHFSDTFRVQLEGKVQEPSADSVSMLTVQPGQDQLADAIQAANATLAGARGTAAAPKLMQPPTTSHDIISIEPLADHAPQAVFTEAAGVQEFVVATPGLQSSSAVVAAVEAPTHIVRPVRAATGESNGTTNPIGVSGVGANQAGAAAPTVISQVGAVQSDVAPDKGLSLHNFVRPTESSIQAQTQAAPLARAATDKSSGTASPIGVSGVAANQAGVVAPAVGQVEAVQSDVAPDKGLSLHNLVHRTESSIPAPTQVAPPARVATGKSSGTASPIGVSGVGAKQASAVVQSDVASDKGLSLHNFVRPTESSIPVSTQVAPSARAAASKSSGTASPLGVSSEAKNQARAIVPAAGQVGAGAVQLDAAPDKGLSAHNLAHLAEPSIAAPTQVVPPTRAATGERSGTASPIRVSGAGENQANAVATAASQVGVGTVQSDVAPDKELSLHNLARFTEASIPTPGQAALAVVPALAATVTGVHGNLQPPPLPLAVATPLPNPGWASAMAARVVWGATQGMQSASIEINPRDLGPVSVNLNVVGEETSIAFVSQHALVREALEAALPRLRELFSGEGLNLGEVDISSGEGRSNGNDDAASADDMQSNGQTDAHADPAMVSSSDEARTHQLDSLVDTFA